MAPAQLARVVATMRRRGVRRENVRSHAALTLTLTLTLTITLTCAHAPRITAPETLSTFIDDRANIHLASRCDSTQISGCTPSTGCSSRRCPRATCHLRAVRRGAKAEQGAQWA